ncbi:MAG: hypothetical protein BWX86_01890 [Verrucomicrobia bacterium ADurb.Bin122]|nr:MAG: hypothetical protein BWX86_01890 [Verrucomicrobia bacterium ADurb.Bin122]
MRQAKGAPRLPFEITDGLGIECHHLGQELQRNLLLQLLIAGQPHHAHTTTPEQTHERVPLEYLLPGGEAAQRLS